MSQGMTMLGQLSMDDAFMMISFAPRLRTHQGIRLMADADDTRREVMQKYLLRARPGYHRPPPIYNVRHTYWT